jgi:hypothetical protein
VLLAKEEAVLQGMIRRVTEIGRCCGMEMNVENFNYLGCNVTKDARCIKEIKSKLQYQKQVTTRRRIFSTANRTDITVPQYSTVLHLERSFKWRRKLETSEGESEMPRKF